MGKIRPNSLPPEGDLPDPATLAAYKEISPETLKTIIEVFIAEAVHQRKLDDSESMRKTQALEAQIAFARRGQIFGLLIGMTAIISGAVTASLGHEWAGSVIGGGGVVGLVSIFVLGRLLGSNAEPSEIAENTP